MFNPFYPFTTQLLNGFTEKGKKYFVRQTFLRARDHFDEEIKGYFLFSHYDNFTTAADHYGAISYDPNRFLYNWDNPLHREKLQVAANHPDGYKIFSSVFKPDWDKHVTSRIKDKLRMYIKKLGWKPDSNEGINTNYELQFGELYIRIKYGTREAKVKFEEIEKMF